MIQTKHDRHAVVTTDGDEANGEDTLESLEVLLLQIAAVHQGVIAEFRPRLD
jgi:hypothetical protein